MDNQSPRRVSLTLMKVKILYTSKIKTKENAEKITSINDMLYNTLKKYNL